MNPTELNALKLAVTMLSDALLVNTVWGAECSQRYAVMRRVRADLRFLQPIAPCLADAVAVLDEHTEDEAVASEAAMFNRLGRHEGQITLMRAQVGPTSPPAL